MFSTIYRIRKTSLSLRKTFRLVEIFSTSFFYVPSSLLECEHKKKLISTYVPG